MHMADALVAPAVAATMYATSAVAAGYSMNKVIKENDEKKMPVMGVMGAFVFATQMINFSIPGTGSSGHLCGGMLLTALLGPYAGFLSMIGVLLIQCLLFADGGLMALGCNIFNMAFYGCFIGGLLIWKPIVSKKVSRLRILIASVVGSMITLQMGAFSVTLETLISGITELPFKTFVMAMQPIHLAIGFVEGLITAAVLIFVYESRPQLLWQGAVEDSPKKKIELKKLVIIFSILTVLIAGGLSIFASSDPDGLEWSIEKLTGATELEGHFELGEPVTAVLPDYNLPDSESILGGSFSGVIGSIVVFVALIGVFYVIRAVGNPKRTTKQ